jgi:putative inorganic carbon (HCO3(-)) transporter
VDPVNRTRFSHIQPKQTGLAPAELASPPLRRMRVAFAFLVLFSALYFLHPLDFAPGLAVVPLEKIIGVTALITLIISALEQRGTFRFTPDIKLLLLFFGQLCLSIPFAYWRGGSFQVVFGGYAKAIIIAIIAMIATNSLARLRTLLFVQAGAVASMATLAIVLRQTNGGRLLVGTSIYGNPNDLALAIALNFPICLAFLLITRNPLKKVLWGTGAVGMLYALILTYSRGGFLATTLSIALCFWEFGIRGRRVALVFLSVVCSVVLMTTVPAKYETRLTSIFAPKADPTGYSSLVARRQLLAESLEIAWKHPLFGIGPGNFQVFSGNWHVAHDTYTEIACEAGIPALILFLLIIRRSFRNLRIRHELFHGPADRDLRLLAGSLWASLGAYLLGAFFTDTASYPFVYFLLAYTAVLHRLCTVSAAKDDRRMSIWEQNGARSREAGLSYRETACVMQSKSYRAE